MHAAAISVHSTYQFAFAYKHRQIQIGISIWYLLLLLPFDFTPFSANQAAGRVAAGLMLYVLLLLHLIPSSSHHPWETIGCVILKFQYSAVNHLMLLFLYYHFYSTVRLTHTTIWIAWFFGSWISNMLSLSLFLPLSRVTSLRILRIFFVYDKYYWCFGRSPTLYQYHHISQLS